MISKRELNYKPNDLVELNRNKLKNYVRIRLLGLTCIVALVGLTLASMMRPAAQKRCLWDMDKCVQECEKGTHPYLIGCNYLTPEPTCDEPKPKPMKKYKVCDFFACYCDVPLVRDRSTGKCVPLDRCPKKQQDTCPPKSKT